MNLQCVYEFLCRWLPEADHFLWGKHFWIGCQLSRCCLGRGCLRWRASFCSFIFSWRLWLLLLLGRSKINSMCDANIHITARIHVTVTVWSTGFSSVEHTLWHDKSHWRHQCFFFICPGEAGLSVMVEASFSTFTLLDGVGKVFALSFCAQDISKCSE